MKKIWILCFLLAISSQIFSRNLVSGKVTDSSGIPLPGVSGVVKGTTIVANEVTGNQEYDDINIIKFGAIADGKTDNTKVIQKAIDECSKLGGGVVFFPSGTYMSGSIFLKSNVTLNLHKLAVVIAIADMKAYSGNSRRRISFIQADSVRNVTIMGEGTIDGSGDHEVFQIGNNGGPRPFLIQLRKSKNIVIKDVHLINSAFWTLQLVENDGIRIDGITIYSLNNWNNDGIDIDSKNVIISNCRIDCDDDAICFKNNYSKEGRLVENVVITNCILGSNCNFIKFDMSKVGFKNVTITNCVLRPAAESNFRYWERKTAGVTDPNTGLSGIALEIDGGILDQITISNIVMTGIQTPVFIRLQQRRPGNIESQKAPVGALKNVLISNIVATAKSRIACSITGIPGSYVENIVIRDMIVNCMGGGTKDDVTREIPEREHSYPDNWMFYTTLPGSSLRHANMPAYGMYIRHAKNVYLDNIQFNLMQPDYRPAIWFEDAHDVRLRSFKATLPEGDQKLIIERESDVKILD